MEIGGSALQAEWEIQLVIQFLSLNSKFPEKSSWPPFFKIAMFHFRRIFLRRTYQYMT